MLRTVYGCVHIGRIKKNLWCNSVRRQTTKTEQIKENILNILNKSDLNLLTRYMEESVAKNIILHRTENGPFESLNNLTDVKDIKLDALNQILINMMDKFRPTFKIRKPMLKPNADIKVPDQVMALHVGSNVISWATVATNYTVQNSGFEIWRDYGCLITQYKLINVVSSIIEKLPLSSAYVVETFPTARSTYKYSAEQMITTSIASCIELVNKERMQRSLFVDNNFYVLQRNVTARFFDLIVGKEIIASKYAIGTLAHYPNIKSENCNIKSRPEVHDQVGWSLLKAITCMYMLRHFHSQNPDQRKIRKKKKL